MRPYPRERLQRYAENTNKAIQSGLAVPFLDKHADVDADPNSALATKGWVQRFSVTDDGWLAFDMEVTDPATGAAIENKSIRFTSPEFRDDFVDGKGKLHGDIIRHVAATPTPRNPDQGAIMSLPAGVARFSIDDMEGEDPKKKKGDTDEDGVVEGEGESDPPPVEPPAKNPDMPPNPDEASKMAALCAGFSQLGLELPSGFTFDSEGAIDILLTAVKTANKAKADTEVKEQDDPPKVNDAQGMTQFSEEEIAALPEAVRVRLKSLQEQAVWFAEEKATHEREKAIAAVTATRLPPGLKATLIAKLQTVQFSESGEVATLTVAEAAKLLSDGLPPSVQFDETEVKEVEFSEGPQEMTEKQAEEHARRIHSRARA